MLNSGNISYFNIDNRAVALSCGPSMIHTPKPTTSPHRSHAKPTATPPAKPSPPQEGTRFTVELVRRLRGGIQITEDKAKRVILVRVNAHNWHELAARGAGCPAMGLLAIIDAGIKANKRLITQPAHAPTEAVAA